MAENFAKRTNFEADAQAALTDRFKRVIVKKVAAILGHQIQDLENTIFEVLDGRGLQSAIGAQLDGLGALVGEPRSGREDDVYRIWIGARIKLNASSGTPDQIIELVRILIAATDENPIYTEYPPAAFLIETLNALDNQTAAQIGAIIGLATPTGVSSGFIYSEEDDADSFIFADDAETTSAEQGCADDDEDGAGGVLAEILE